MKSKKYYIDLINHNKIIKESETLNSNGEIDLYLQLSPTEHSSNKMTINELAKVVNSLANTVNTLVNTVNDLTQRVDDLTQRVDNLTQRVDDLTLEMREGFKRINKRLDEHDVILKKHSEIFARNNLE